MTDRSLEILIDEVVLGLASEAERARIEDLAAQDPGVAAMLDAARARFAPLDDTAPAMPLPAGLWEGIAARLDAGDIGDAAPAEDGLRDAAKPQSAADAAAPDVSARESVSVVPLAQLRERTRLRRWRAAAMGAMAASLLLAAAMGWTMLGARDPLVVAVLLDAGGEPVALIESGADNATRVTLLERPDLPEGRVMQVWTKPDAEGPPVSLGLLSAGRSAALTVEGLPAPGPRQLYEITSEPAGGSPTNLPTGPILGVGLAKAPVI